ncbi:MAG: TatD family hydrolase, partial [Planctomycetes bacterium]|nr:TatD family hydrolase [Planctomycetota bacterium]
MYRYIDTHCHLSSNRFASDTDQVIQDSTAAGIGVLAVAADLDSSRKSLALAERHAGVLASVGIHPTGVGGQGDAEWREILNLARSSRVAAIGETGLDYYWKTTGPALQKEWFLRHIELSQSTGK